MLLIQLQNQVICTLSTIHFKGLLLRKQLLTDASIHNPCRADSHPEDEDRPPSRAPWESSAQNGRADFPGPAGDGSGRVYSDDRWTPKARAGFPPRPGFATQDR